MQLLIILKPNAASQPPITVTGAAMLWVGWFGFNGGSALGANGDAASALVVTQISAATATLVWMFVEWIIAIAKSNFIKNSASPRL